MPDPEQSPRELTILMAEDDPEDRAFAEEALAEARLVNDLHTVEDGQELLEYLRGEGDYADPADAPRPGIILLDLQMPRMGGLEALEQIKQDPELRRIPVVILTSSKADEDISRSYDLGVNAFIRKPVSFDGLVDAMKGLGHFWFQLVELPEEGSAA